MSVIDDFEGTVRQTVDVIESAVLAFQGRDQRIADLIAQLAAQGEISGGVLPRRAP